MLKITTALLVATCGLVGGCSSSSSDTGTTADGGTGGSDSGTTTAGGCNSVAINAPVITDATGAGAKPTPAGGTIADGKYFVTAQEYFGQTPPGKTYNVVFEVSGGTANLAQINNSGPEERFTLTLATSGTTFSATASCPAAVAGKKLDYDQFTATPTSLVLFNPKNGAVVTFTKQ